MFCKTGNHHTDSLCASNSSCADCNKKNLNLGRATMAENKRLEREENTEKYQGKWTCGCNAKSENVDIIFAKGKPFNLACADCNVLFRTCNAGQHMVPEEKMKRKVGYVGACRSCRWQESKKGPKPETIKRRRINNPPPGMKYCKRAEHFVPEEEWHDGWCHTCRRDHLIKINKDRHNKDASKISGEPK